MENITKNIEIMKIDEKEVDQYECQDQIMLQALNRQISLQEDSNKNEKTIDIISYKK